MRNFGKWFGVIAIVLVIGFSFAACKKDSLDGTTWKGRDPDGGELVLRFNNPDHTLTRSDGTLAKGSYAISGVTIIMTWTDNFDVKTTGTLAGNTLSINLGRGETIEFTKQ
jgi:hypothetical protein